MNVSEKLTLTTLHRDGGSLQRQHLPAGLRDVHSEHHADPRVLSSYIRLPLPQLDVRVPQLENASTVNAAKQRENSWPHTESLGRQRYI